MPSANAPADPQFCDEPHDMGHVTLLGGPFCYDSRRDCHTITLTASSQNKPAPSEAGRSGLPTPYDEGHCTVQVDIASTHRPVAKEATYVYTDSP